MRRRELLAAAAVAVVARPAAAVAAADATADILVRLIALEEAAALALPRRGGLPRCPASPSQEADHAKALRTDLEALGGRAPSARRPTSRRSPGSTARSRSRRGWSPPTGQALVDLEELGLLQTVATILASHAQHHALLLRAAGRDPFG